MASGDGTRARRLGLALAAVAATLLALPGGPAPLLAFVCTMPILLAVRGLGPAPAAALGGLYGLLIWLGNLGGVAEAAQALWNLPAATGWALALPVALWQALPYAAAAAAGEALAFRLRPGPAGLARAAAWTIPIAWFPDLLPGNVAHALYPFPLLVQPLDLGGVPLLLFSVLVVNAWAAEALAAGNARRAAGPALLAAGTIAATAAYGAWRIEAVAAAGGVPFRVGTVQPDIRLDRRDPHWGAGERHAAGHARLHDLAASLLARPDRPDLVVLPEQPLAIDAANTPERTTPFTALAAAGRRPILMTGSGPLVGDAADGPRANLAWLLDETGRTVARHGKRRLVPIAEYLPYEARWPSLRRLVPFAGGRVPGGPARIIPLGETVRIVPAICYEGIFHRDLAAGIAQGGNVLVNPVNDTWFGETRLGELHFALTLYGGVAYRVPLVRAANSGRTAIVTATGHLAEGGTLPRFTAGTAIATVTIPPVRSFYAAHGNLFLHLLTAAAAVGAGSHLAMAARRRRVPARA